MIEFNFLVLLLLCLLLLPLLPSQGKLLPFTCEMSGLEFADEQELKQAIAEVRSDSSDTDWVLFSYEGPKSQKIVLVGKGGGGVSALVEHLKDDMVGYALVRKTDKIDDSVTVKFGYIFWLGENTPRMQKARLSVHQGEIRKFIGQFHVDITASSLDELSDDILQAKIMDTSGSASRVMTSASGSRVESTTSGGSALKSGAKNATGELQIKDEDEVKRLFKTLRSGEGIDWLLMSYSAEDQNQLEVVAHGDGGVENLLSHLNDEIVGYALVRKVEVIDLSEAIKFVFIKFQGENIPRMLKARIGTHAGKVTQLFSQTQRTVPITKGATAAPTSPRGVSSTATKIPAVPKSQGQSPIKFTDEEQVKNALKAVRNDSDPTNWCLVGYEGKKGNTLTLLGSGSEGLSELLPLLEEDMVGYALLRKTEKFDESITVKFVYLTYTGPNINRMHRARLGTYSGAVAQLFTPYHVDFPADSVDEITEEAIVDRVGFASGTRSHVK